MPLPGGSQAWGAGMDPRSMSILEHIPAWGIARPAGTSHADSNAMTSTFTGLVSEAVSCATHPTPFPQP